jgi:acetylornithine deacetylase/succinyl-diaminopimelate desuccinylase-like protein
MSDAVLASIRSRKDASLAKLFDFLKFPSVSTKSEHKPDMKRCAEWLANELREIGLKAEILPTGSDAKPGHPVVFATNDQLPGRPTVLVYGHYDVQPAENDKGLRDWVSGPFEPQVRKDKAGHDAIYARGSVDDKGQVWLHVEALRAWKQHGGLNLNLKLLIEGEEEIGSENLEKFVAENKDKLKADLCLISDTGFLNRDTPTIGSGVRGLVYEEVVLTGPSTDLHSGGYGGAVVNPANLLCKILASLHDAQTGRVTIPSFYDDVPALTDADRRQIAALPIDVKQWAADIGLTPDDLLGGEQGYTVMERITARPTLDINGLTAGYQGEGAKTVIGNKASAKVSMRLVPNQDPKKIKQLFRDAVKSRVPRGFKCEFVLDDHDAYPYVAPVDWAGARAAGSAFQQVFGKAPVFVRSGGTLPVAGMLKHHLQLDTLFVGFGLPDDAVHAPNEKFDLGLFHKGQETLAILYGLLQAK